MIYLYLLFDILSNYVFGITFNLFLIPLIKENKIFNYLIIGLTLDLVITNTYFNTIILIGIYLINHLFKNKSIYFLFIIDFLILNLNLNLIYYKAINYLNLILSLLINLLFLSLSDNFHLSIIKFYR